MAQEVTYKTVTSRSIDHARNGLIGGADSGTHLSHLPIEVLAKPHSNLRSLPYPCHTPISPVFSAAMSPG